ncbi:MAG: ATPase, T2SS/T4P/T4SS family [Planctomycetota bacterium]
MSAEEVTNEQRLPLEDLLASLVRTGASSVMLVPGHPPLVRVQGTLVPTEGPPLDAAGVEALLQGALFEDQWERVHAGEEVHALYTAVTGERFRTAIMRQDGGVKAILRRVPQQVPSFESLGLPELLSSFIEFQSGLVVLTGVLGSGKSTTLAAMVDRLNRTTNEVVVTLEQPIEYLFEASSALVHQRELGVHVCTYSQGVLDAANHGADVVVVGDLCDYDTLEAAVTAAEKGLLVLTTVHASGVVGSLYDLVSMCPVDERPRMRVRLAHVLRAVMSQALIRRSQTKGRVPVLEILINNANVRQHLRSGAFQELPAVMEKSRGLGMQTVDQGLRALLARNLISVDEALYHATNRDAVAGNTTRRVAASPRA